MGNREEARQLELEALMHAPSNVLLLEPFEYFFAEHFRQRTLCNVLDRFADEGLIDMAIVSATISFLKQDFGRHVQDEEEDLFPVLRKRAEPEDEIDKVLGQLSEEHASSKTDSVEILLFLGKQESSTESIKLHEEAASLLKRFAANERHHLVLENAIVLPMAKARLTDNDKRELSMRMAERRGVNFADLKAKEERS